MLHAAWKRRQRVDLSLTAKHILRSSNQRANVPHFNPQSNITGPNNSNVVTAGVFGNLQGKNMHHPVCHPVCPTDASSHSQRKQRLSSAAESDGSPSWMVVIMWQDNNVFVSFHYCVLVLLSLKTRIEQNHWDSQPSWPRLWWTFPQKTASHLASESQTAFCLLMAIMYHFPGCLVGQDLNYYTS